MDTNQTERKLKRNDPGLSRDDPGSFLKQNDEGIEMISQDETLVKIPRWCQDCGDTYDREHLALVEDSDGRRRCHRPTLYCNACRSNFRPSAPVPEDMEDMKGWEIHACAPCPFCGAPREWKNGYCSCPEGKVETAKRKAEAKAVEKVQQEAADQAKLDRAIFEKKRATKRLQEEERMEETSKAGIAASRKIRERRELDTELRDREQTLKGRELSRRERRQDGFDAIAAIAEATEATEPVAGLTLADFETPMDGSDLDLAPTAMLIRKDGATLLYEGKLNFIFGTPGSGKSWVALHCVHEALMRRNRVIYWDHEDTASTLKRRSSLMGLDLADFWADGQFKYLRAGLDGSTLAMTEALEWVQGGDGPTLVVIDSAESAGCPSDGADVAPWLSKLVLPFLEAGATVLVIDHVPKRKEGRPLGPIGSQHKLARIDGAALLVTGVPWTQKTDGHLVLTNHKDRHGQLPAPNGKAVARVIGTHEHGTLYLNITSPEKEDNLEEAYIPTLRALMGAGPDGVHGQRAMRDLVVGRGNQKDKTISDLVEFGYILKTRGKKVHYSITAEGLEEVGDSDD